MCPNLLGFGAKGGGWCKCWDFDLRTGLAMGAFDLVLEVTLEADLFKPAPEIFGVDANRTYETPSSTNVSGKVNCALVVVLFLLLFLNGWS